MEAEQYIHQCIAKLTAAVTAEIFHNVVVALVKIHFKYLLDLGMHNRGIQRANGHSPEPARVLIDKEQ